MIRSLTDTATSDFNCVFCGSQDLRIVRDTPDPRLLCNSCNGTFDGSQSKAAEEAGLIPSSSQETLNKAEEPETYETQATKIGLAMTSKPLVSSKELSVPRTPSYVFVSKDRNRVEFSTKKDVKRVTLRWEEYGKYDLFELVAKTSNVKVDIQ